MFDVYWTDHNRELVGERIVRKEREEREAKAREGDGKKHDNLRHSISTSSTSSERGFSFFGTKERNRVTTLSKVGYVTQIPGHISEIVRDRSASAHGAKKFPVHHGAFDASSNLGIGEYLPVQHPSTGESLPSPSSRDSVTSKWTQPSLAPSSTLASSSPRHSVASKSEHLIQTLGPSSFVVKTTQIMVAPRGMGGDVDHVVSEVHISSDRVKAVTPPLAATHEEGIPMPFDDSDSSLLLVRLPQTPPPVDPSHNACVAMSEHRNIGNIDVWKPPNEWDCANPREIPTPSHVGAIQNHIASSDNVYSISPNLAALQREIRMMAAASPELILASINSVMSDATDAMVYKELEMTKKRWMFSALHQNDKYAATLNLGSFHPGVKKSSRNPRVLAIYETHASATFLAALHPDVKISHLSPSPVSPKLFPNIQPILVPAISAVAASRPLPPQLFSAVTCLSIPSLFPSTDIPPFLRSVHRCLAVGGALHLTLIDPEPVPNSMGPKLRQWLIDNLLTNLEQAFRTTLPSRTLPTWLAVSRLRGRGSTIISLSIPATPEGFLMMKGVKNPGPVKADLRCTVLRMLWREIWGNFVHARSWWWEEDEIIQECIDYGTYWVYSHVVAVKEN